MVGIPWRNRNSLYILNVLQNIHENCRKRKSKAWVLKIEFFEHGFLKHKKNSPMQLPTVIESSLPNDRFEDNSSKSLSERS